MISLPSTSTQQNLCLPSIHINIQNGVSGRITTSANVMLTVITMKLLCFVTIVTFYTHTRMIFCEFVLNSIVEIWKRSMKRHSVYFDKIANIMREHNILVTLYEL